MIKSLLVSEGHASEWFADLESLHPDATIKSKSFAEAYSPESLEYYLIDDKAACVANEEYDWWVSVPEFLPPYDMNDDELTRVKTALEDRLGIPHPWQYLHKEYKLGVQQTFIA